MAGSGRRILVTGALGQIGTDLVPALRERYGADQVVAAGHHKAPSAAFHAAGPFVTVDVVNPEALETIITRHEIGTVYHLASLLSAGGEEAPDLAWNVNVNGLKAVLDAAVRHKLDQVFWPSSIAVFGPTTPRFATPQHTVLEPTTMYGVTKVAGENLCNYYFHRHGLDVRSLRYPGLITAKTFSGGGTSDYAVEIFLEATKHGRYTCFVEPRTTMPMMYMDDAVRGTIELMAADGDRLTVRTSYNIGAQSFSAADLAAAVGRRIDGFRCDYEPDFRQAIANSWPDSVEDSAARQDWGWSPHFDLEGMVDAMLDEIRRSPPAH